MSDKKAFNKLVRDRIPEIIENDGDIPEIEIVDDPTYTKLLEDKLLEECNEVLSAIDTKSKVEEIADTLEVLYTMIDLLGVTLDDVDRIRLNKKEKRGAFKKRILLKSTMKKCDNHD